jgi:hypothetical protein
MSMLACLVDIRERFARFASEGALAGLLALSEDCKD